MDRINSIQARVLYADTDKMNVAYYATYLRWFEAGRAHYMRMRDFPYKDVEKTGIQLPVIEAHCNYISPARYDDVLDVRAQIGELKGAQLRFEYEIERDGELLATGYTKHASINGDGRPVRLPEQLRSALLSQPKTDVKF